MFTKHWRVVWALILCTARLVPGQGSQPRQWQEEFYRTRAYPGTSIPAGARAAAVATMDRMIAGERQAAGGTPTGPAWTPIGPRPISVIPEYGPIGGGTPYSSGRVSALAVDPRDSNVAYAGAAGGGVWKTTDGGQNWQPLTDSQASLATGSIALAPSNPDVVYVGTGEQNNTLDSYFGAGILKSSDGGATWTQLAGPFVGPFSSSSTSGGGAHIGALAVHPTDPNTVLAGVDRTPQQGGIYRSSDGGATWTLALGGPGAVGAEVIFNPADPTIAYAAIGSSNGNAMNGVYKSTDTGATWNPANGAGSSTLPTFLVGRIALAIAPSRPSTLYAGVAVAGGFFLIGMYRSDDGGQSWNLVSSPDYCSPQCQYDNVIRVNPKNPNILVAAGLPPFRSLDGGLSWSNIAIGASGVIAHTDHHALAFSSDGARLYDGNDGGVSSTSNLSSSTPTWANLNATLAITEFVANVSIHPSDPHIAIAGSQDNGTLSYTGGLSWDQIAPGDGGSTAIDPAVPGIWYGAFQGPQIFQVSGVPSLSNIFISHLLTDPILANGISLADRFLAYGPLVMDPSNPLRIYYASQRLYQTKDGAGTWTAISPDLTGGKAAISAIAVSASFPSAVAVGTSDGLVKVSNTVLLSGATVWVDRSTGLPGRSISQVAFDSADVSTLYVTLSGFSGFLPADTAGHVFKSTNFGNTWTDISGTLPNIPVNDIVLDPDLPGTLYIATDIGVFQSPDGGQTWSTLSNGLPKVLVRSLNLHRSSRTLRAATSGRGMWDLSLPVAKTLQPHIGSQTTSSLGGNPGVTLNGSNFTPNSTVRWNGTDRPTGFVNSSTLTAGLNSDDLTKAGRATLVVYNSEAGAGLSNSVNVPVGPPPVVSPSGVTSAANPLSSAALTPGSIYSIYGTDLAADTVIAAAPPLPYTLGGVTVEVNGIPAALFSVSPTAINFQVPWEVEGYDRATVTVINGTQVSATIQVKVATAAPALFATNGGGSGQGAIVILGPGVLAAPVGAFPGSRPVRSGEILQIYATGLGSVSRAQSDGTPKSTTPAISRTPGVTIGGLPAAVTFAGLLPGSVGVYQVLVQMPGGVSSGDAVPVVITLEGLTSNTVTVAVGP